MKLKPLLAPLILLAAGLPCAADLFTLKDGSKIEGTILKDSGDSYVIEVLVTKTIKDERKVLKADVVNMVQDKPDLVAFEKVAKFVPTPDFLGADEYRVQISAIEKFIQTYPKSLKLGDVKKMLTTLQAEAAQVTAGGIKSNGAILSASQYQADAFAIDARLEEAKIEALINADQIVAALRAFKTFEVDFMGTQSYLNLVPAIKRLIQGHILDSEELLLSLDARLKKRKAGLEQMSQDDRKITEAAIEEETEMLEAQFNSEKETKVEWVTPSPYHREALTETVGYGKAELAKMNSAKIQVGLDAGQAYQQAWNLLHNGGAQSAITAAMASAKTAGVSASYYAKLEAVAKKP